MKDVIESEEQSGIPLSLTLVPEGKAFVAPLNEESQVCFISLAKQNSRNNEKINKLQAVDGYDQEENCMVDTVGVETGMRTLILVIGLATVW